MSSVTRNMAANVIGQAVVAVATVAFVPTYIRHLGMEAYGLIGVFTTLQVLMTLFDAGMSPTLNREMARYTSHAIDVQQVTDLIRSVEIIAFTIAAAAAAGVALLSGVVSRQVLNLATMPPSTARVALSIIGIVVALRFVESIYRSAIIGLQLQVWFNAANGTVNVLRFGGAAVVVAFVSPTIQAFFLWQAAVAVGSVLLLRTRLAAAFPRPPRPPHFSPTALRTIQTFALGMLGISVSSVLLSQADKLLLVRLLPLAAFGTYSLAFAVTSILTVLSIAINQATLPVMVGEVSRHDEPALIATHSRTAQMVAVAVVPAACVFIGFPGDVLVLWSGDRALAASAARLVVMAAAGNLLNALMVLPYFTMLAHGWTRLPMLSNVVAASVLVPGLILIVPVYGTVGAASAWIVLNAGYVLIQAPLMHRRILRGRLWSWYRRGILMPVAAAVAVGLAATLIRDTLTIPRPWLTISLGLTWSLMTAAVVAISPTPRADLLARRRA